MMLLKFQLVTPIELKVNTYEFKKVACHTECTSMYLLRIGSNRLLINPIIREIKIHSKFEYALI